MMRWALLGLAACACLAVQAPDCRLVPGWEQQGPTRSYVADNLFDYMDGNAEGYIIYGFTGMKGITCKSGENTILIDISEMAGPDMAYGIFAANRDPRLPIEKIGMLGQVQPRRAIFAKDKYYIELAATPDKDHTAALRGFVAAVESRISGRTDLPATLGWFPREKLASDSIRLVPESVLGLRLLKRGYVAEYDYGKAFIVAEVSPESASAVMTKLRARFGETEAVKIADDAFRFTDKYLGRLCIFRQGRYVAGYANLAGNQDATALATALASKIP